MDQKQTSKCHLGLLRRARQHPPDLREPDSYLGRYPGMVQGEEEVQHLQILENDYRQVPQKVFPERRNKRRIPRVYIKRLRRDVPVYELREAVGDV